MRHDVLRKIYKYVPVVMALGVSPGFAQDASEEGEWEYILEEVIVTAQRREQNIQDVPISISAYSGDFLRDNGIGTVSEVARMTPNFTVSFGSQETNTRLAIRGIGSVGNNALEPSVGVFVDGVYYPRPGTTLGRVLDVKSFEVLRGPQGTLFGRNTPVGALNISTNDPTDMFALNLEASAGDYAAWGLRSVLNGPLGETASGRFAIQYFERDGYGFNTYDGKDFGARDELQTRGKVKFDFNDRSSLLLTADYSKLNGEGGVLEVLNSTDSPYFEGTLQALFGASASTRDSYDWVINQDQRDKLDDTQWGISADFNYQTSADFRFRSITAYREWQADSVESALRIPTNMIPRFTDYQTDTFSEELQLLSPEGESVDWILGLFYYRENYTINQAFSAGDTYCVPVVAVFLGPEAAGQCLAFEQDRFVESDFTQSLDSFAGFGQFTWYINEKWSVTGGGRCTHEKKDGDFIQVVRNPYATLIRSPEIVTGMRVDDSHFTWLANLSWYPNDELMLYATASTGYKSGGFNSEGAEQPLGAEKRVFGPEDSTNYELGIKSTLFHNSMTANINLYRLDLNDFQNLGFDGLSFIVLNAGKLRQQGVEADINWVPTSALRIVSGVSYLDSEYLSFPGAPGLPGDPGTQDLKGERSTFSPKWQASVQADWTGSLTSNLDWRLGGGWRYLSEQNIGSVTNNNPQTIQAPYSLFNARISVIAVTGKWDVTLFGENLGNAGYCVNLFDQPFGAQLNAQDATANTMVQRCQAGPPRTWYLRARWWF